MTSQDSLAAVLKVLQTTGTPKKAAALKAALCDTGVPAENVDKAWKSIQPRLKAHANVVLDGLAYRWTDEPRTLPPSTQPSPVEALELLLKGGRPATAKKAALAEIIRSALTNSPGPIETVKNEPSVVDDDTAMRLRQARVDGLRQFADLASEVEELIVGETAPGETVERVRAWSQRIGLDPIGRAGEEIRFDRKVHKPIGAGIRDGATVFVVRPGYYWRTADQDVLLGKAVVEE